MEGHYKLNNSIRNIIFGIFRYSLSIVFPFVIRTIMLKRFGSEYTGLGSLFSSILQVLNLSELGFSEAIIFCLYRPLAEKNDEKVIAYLSFFKKIYRVIGMVILFGGLIVTPVIKYLIQGDYPESINIYILFLLYLVNASISYFFGGYKSVLFIATQRADIQSKIQIISNLLIYTLQIVVLICSKNYYLYALCLIVGSLVTNFLLVIAAKKLYPQFVGTGFLEKKEKVELSKNITALFGHQLDGIIINSADNIIISAFIGLNILTIYNNYYYIISAAISLMIVIANSFVASIGEAIAVKKAQVNYKQFMIFTYILGLMNIVTTILMISLFQDFIKLWVGTNMVLPFNTVFLTVISFYARQFRRSLLTYKNASGKWQGDRFKPYIAAIFNLIGNIVLVKIIGLNGVILSTIISLVVIEIPWETKVLFKQYFHCGTKEYCKLQGRLIVKMVVVGLIVMAVSSLIEVHSWIGLIAKAVVLIGLTLICILLFCIKDEELIKTLDYFEQFPYVNRLKVIILHFS